MASSEITTVSLLLLDLIGVFTFALSGGLAAVRKSFDILGVIMLSAAAGLGGGVLRDILIGATPPVGVSDWRLVTAACAAGTITFFFHPGVVRIRRLVLFLDAIGLGVFAIAGTLKALEMGLSPLTAVIVGVITGIGGGMIRDLLAGEVPHVLAHRELYATPAVAGTVLFAALWPTSIPEPAVTVVSVTLIAGLRLFALRRHWQAPSPRMSAG